MKKRYLLLTMLPLMLTSCATTSQQTQTKVDDIIPTITESNDVLNNYYNVSYITDSHVSVYVYDGQDYTQTPSLQTNSHTKTQDGEDTMSDGQVNFLLVFDEGYELDSISCLEGTYKNIKYPSDTNCKDVYRITKITQDTIVSITSKEIDDSIKSYKVLFDLDENVSVLFYDTQDYTKEPYQAEYALSKDGETGEETKNGGQVNFKIVLPEGYEVKNITAILNTYSNIKLIDEENLIYRITKITSDTTVIIKSKHIGDDSIYTLYNDNEYTLSCDVDNASYLYENDKLTINCDGEANITLSGDYYGEIYITGDESSSCKIVFNGFNMISSFDNVFVIDNINEASISIQANTNNYINDIRSEIGEENYSASIYCVSDLDIKGTGTLEINSLNGNGIHSKDDLKIKNATLSINVCDNALKGNDSVVIDSGDLTLISRIGDGIKTSNSSLKKDGVTNKGNVEINGGTINIYSACDGIDAAYNVIINNDPVINIYTDKYSDYSEEVTAVSESTLYIKSSSSNYKYSIYFYNTQDDGVWVNSANYSYLNNSYYYQINKPSNYLNFTIYVYTQSQNYENIDNYYQKASGVINEAYDTINYSRNSFSWTNYQSQSRPGMPGGNDGNTDTKNYSTKGIKADNEIIIFGGNINIKSYDDSIHSNNDNELENEQSPLGNVTISGGNITLYSNDDAIHADNTLTINGGTVKVESAYEGLEGNIINITDGNIDVYATDDGINASDTNAKILVSGGYLNVLVGQGDTDAIDSNGTYTQTGGIVICSNLQTQGMATALDTDSTVTISGGVFIAFGNIERTPNLSNVKSKSLTGSFKSGEYKLLDSNNNEILKFTLETTYQKLYIAASSGSYRLVGDETTVISL